jgi:hypothetical protein
MEMVMAATCQKRDSSRLYARDERLPDSKGRQETVDARSAANTVQKPTQEMELWWELARLRA